MKTPPTVQSRISARDGAYRLINQLTAGVAMFAFGALGVFTIVSAATVPGSAGAIASASTTSSSSSDSSTSDDDSTTSSSSSSTSGLQSSGSVSSSTGTGIVVSGGSH